MISSFFLCFFIIPVILAHHKSPLVQKQGLHGAYERRFWRMPTIHPISQIPPMLRKELERDPGILIGKADDFLIAQIRKGDFSSLGKNRNPAEIFFRKQRSSEQPQCIIEVQMVMSHLGRCVKLADNTPACQNDQYVSINSKECN